MKRQDGYGTLIEPATLEIQRLLPGPIERVWSYLTDSSLRGKWLAAGPMELKPGSAYAFTWRNDDLSDPPSARPEGFPEEHHMAGRIIAVDVPRRLEFTWGEQDASVLIELEPMGGKVLLKLTHRRLSDHAVKLNVSAGWHTHLDILAARLSLTEPEPFWPTWQRLKSEYELRIGV
ncbi:MAG: SRPBCC family protein [Proteobacteria bacterium]|nr:SRPBCC family protein [Pseudomonadota bacterium]